MTGGDERLGPAQWLDTVLAARRAAWAEAEVEPDGSVALAELVDPDGDDLEARHRRLVAEGVPPKAAATYLAGWFAGGLADAVGVGLAGAAAGFCVDAARARFAVHADGWPIESIPGGPVVVAGGHPWAGGERVEVVATVDEVVGRAVDALVATVTPLVDACRALAPVGRAGLWNEVGDALGSVLSYQRVLEADADVTALLRSAVDRPGVPWKARPRLGFAPSARLGPVPVSQKGGCCLAYTRARPSDDPSTSGPQYCSTCSFRDGADCDARQVRWREDQAARIVS